MSDRIIIPKPAQKRLDNVSKIVIRPIFFLVYFFWCLFLKYLSNKTLKHLVVLSRNIGFSNSNPANFLT